MLDKDRLFQESIDSTVEAMKANPALSFEDPKTPWRQHIANLQLSEMEKYCKEDKFYLFKAMALCARHGLPMPEWVSKAFLSGFYKITLAQVENSWDAAFGRPYPEGSKMPRLEEQRRLKFSIYDEVVRLRAKHPDLAINSYLYDKLAKKFGIGKDVVASLYKSAKSMVGPDSPGKIKIVVSSKLNRCQPRPARSPMTSRRKKKKLIITPQYKYPPSSLLSSIHNGENFNKQNAA
ncbi:MAG: hypothetical protein IPH22_08970 [Nitrosomonas sp.]|nr:hypothetical protein [Nitrosomonas sp.]